MGEARDFHLLTGWLSMIAGALSGAAIGLFFHREDWLGGYGSFRRRMLRLGHIAFFGLGILNVLFALSINARPLASHLALASTGFWLAALTMPACCFLTAWRASLRHVFPVPVMALTAGIAGLLMGWSR